jgi:hypothetical protein
MFKTYEELINFAKMAWVSKDGKALKVREENVGDYMLQGFHRGIK